jgi:hypothetical protein
MVKTRRINVCVYDASAITKLGLLMGIVAEQRMLQNLVGMHLLLAAEARSYNTSGMMRTDRKPWKASRVD